MVTVALIVVGYLAAGVLVSRIGLRYRLGPFDVRPDDHTTEARLFVGLFTLIWPVMVVIVTVFGAVVALGWVVYAVGWLVDRRRP